ncbi:hypothetical protein [Ornithobacterium rhinotracheale]|uniref:hypothetical protein n=1 Tax=Ornithobacterium rhinotracheale TaxID=28251 RepID=UPI001FF447A1|nr:hypothetical protein [Ornithobacterium rhinotracheale]MCK0201347.1 hypothetical protein [Ornithobacterium rhinotracheale]
MRVSKEKKQKIKDLVFYLEFYKELASRSGRMRNTADKEIERLINEIKKMD